MSSQPYLTAAPTRPRGTYRVSLNPVYWRTGPLRPLIHTEPTDEESVTEAWAARLSYLDNPHPRVTEPTAPRRFRSAELALPAEGDTSTKDAYRYPLILRLADPEAAQALADQLAALAVRLREAAPDPYGGCAACARSFVGVCESCATADLTEQTRDDTPAATA